MPKGTRVSASEAIARGWITKDQVPTVAPQIKKALGAKPNPLEDQLVAAVQARYPGAIRNYRCLPPRRFSLDVALPDVRVGIELDGYGAHHHIDDYRRDREKRNLLAAAGWLVLAFPSLDVRCNMSGVLDLVEQTVRTAKRFAP